MGKPECEVEIRILEKLEETNNYLQERFGYFFGETLLMSYVRIIDDCFTILEHFEGVTELDFPLYALATAINRISVQFPQKIVLVKCTSTAFSYLKNMGLKKLWNENKNAVFILPPKFSSLKALDFWDMTTCNLKNDQLASVRSILSDIQALEDIEEVPHDSVHFNELKEIRIQVFVDEQKVPLEEEFDGFDESSVHLGYRDHLGSFVGVCRLRVVLPFIKLERVAVLQAHRKYRIGSKLNEAAVRLARQRFPHLLLVAHAQSTVKSFYQKLGFIVVSKDFLEVDIPHCTVVLPPTYSNIDGLSVLNFDEVATCHNYIKGECFDPEVFRCIRELLKSIKSLDYIHVSSLRYFLDSEKLGIGIVNKFTTYSSSVNNIQKIGDHCLLSDEPPSIELEDLLLDMGWDKLNTGHFAQVDDCWRIFYASISLCKSVRLANDNNLRESLQAADMGLLLGRSPSDNVLNKWAEVLANRLTPIKLPNFTECSISTPSSLKCSQSVISSASISDEIFLTNFLLQGIPVHIVGAVKEWSATKKWNFDFLNNLLCHRTVPVELGEKYTEDSWSQRLMTGYEFFSGILGPNRQKKPMYLAQHRLLDQIPRLKSDIIIPEYCLLAGCSEKDIDMNIWIGPSETLSPLHTDPRENLFCQISGRKFIRLISPVDSEKVYANESGILTNTSQVDAENPDLEKFPLFASAHCYDAIVEAGDALFIPKGWWHHVRALSPSISLSFWFDQ